MNLGYSSFILRCLLTNSSWIFAYFAISSVCLGRYYVPEDIAFYDLPSQLIFVFKVKAPQISFCATAIHTKHISLLTTYKYRMWCFGDNINLITEPETRDEAERERDFLVGFSYHVYLRKWDFEMRTNTIMGTQQSSLIPNLESDETATQEMNDNQY